MAEDTLLIPGSDGFHAKRLSDPFWAEVARMQPGALVRAPAPTGGTEICEVQDGPRYGRPEVNDVSVIVRPIGTRQTRTLAAWCLSPCEARH
jgi:hypothetical protein